MKSLIELRMEIDHIDNDIIKLLEKRFEVVKEIKKYKMEEKLNSEDLGREKEILNRLRNLVQDESCVDNIESVYKTIFLESKKIQD